MSGTKRMYTSDGEEVYSFSQLRNEFAEVETFYLDTGARAISPVSVITGSPLRRSRSSNGIMAPVVQNDVSQMHVRQRARSKSRPRVLYAADSEVGRSNGGKHSATNRNENENYILVFFIPKNIHHRIMLKKNQSK